MTTTIVIGSRGNALALTQSRHVASQIELLALDIAVRIEVIRTTGDRVLDAPLAKIGGKGLFTKELEVALLERRIDAAVHSMKDLPTELPDGLIVGATPPREDPRDAFVSHSYSSVEALPDGAVVGTSSLRRAAQLRAHRPRLRLVDLRGNVDTRLRKVAEGHMAATLLACAGLRRLGRAEAITQALDPEFMTPAPGQGALAIETRDEDGPLRDVLSRINDPKTEAEVTAERACLTALGGGCQLPLGTLARCTDGELDLMACVCSVDGSRVLRTRLTGMVSRAEELGRQAADDLLRQGAGDLLNISP